MEESSPRRGSAVVVLILVVMALISLQGVSSLVSDSAESDPQGAQGGEPGEAGELLPTDSLEPSPEPKPSKESSPEPESDVDVASIRFKRFAHPYPKACLQAVERPVPGRLAAFQGGNVSIVPPGGSRSVIRFSAERPISWSPSGRYLATGAGDLYRANGRAARPLLPEGSALWEWSTIADCAVALDGAGLSVAAPDFDGRALVKLPGAIDLSFSPDGRRLGFVLSPDNETGASIWIADLERGSARRVETFSRRIPVVKLLGWNAVSSHLFYGISGGESLAADGVTLRFLAARGKEQGRAGATLLAYDSYLTHCGTRDLVVAGAGRETSLNKRLAYLTPSGPSYITPTSAVVTSPSCSPDGGFIASVAASAGANASTRRLAILRSDGSFERFLAPDGSGDEYPVWGPRGTGLSFIRMRPSGKLADVWFIPEGASARPTPLVVAVPPNNHGHYDWSQVFDWSAAP